MKSNRSSATTHDDATPHDQSIPALSADAEQTLGYRWRDRHDIASAHRLAGCHRHLVVDAARQYRDCGLSWDDLTAEGQFGLMRAVCHFDPDHGIRFASFAERWVRAAIRQAVRSTRRPHPVMVGHPALRRSIDYAHGGLHGSA